MSCLQNLCQVYCWICLRSLQATWRNYIAIKGFKTPLFGIFCACEHNTTPNAKARNKLLDLPSFASRRKVFDACMVHKVIDFRETSKGFTMKQSCSLWNSRTKGGLLKTGLTRPKANLYVSSFLYRTGNAYLKLTKNMSTMLTMKQIKRFVSKACLQGKESR